VDTAGVSWPNSCAGGRPHLAGVAGELLTGVRHVLDRALKLLLHFLCLFLSGDQAVSAPRQLAAHCACRVLWPAKASY
jgi:hypothetical protein